MELEEDFKNQVMTNDNGMDKIGKIYNLSKATIKIYIENSIASGFFIKFERNKKPFYCLMTNQHVISPKIMQNDKRITILYDNEQKKLVIDLNQKERIIIFFLEILKMDVTLIEIIPKDNIIDPSYFLSPYIDNNDNNNFNPYRFIRKGIEVFQYPEGGELSLSKGIILGMYPNNDNIFIHNSNTKEGSSGSPIFLSGSQTVFAIHKGVYKVIEENAGIFIDPIVKYLINYKRNGKGIEYYENGSIKYEGEFSEDEYNGKGKLFYPNGDYYIGQFIFGKKSGNGYEYYKNGIKKNKPDFELDKYNSNFIQNELKINKIININKLFQVVKSVAKINYSNCMATGFFIKFESNKNPFYCLMTIQHLISHEKINKEESIYIIYENNEKYLRINLNEKERNIISFMEINNLDITLIEIIQKDGIDESNFLKPYTGPNNQMIGKKISIIHFPFAKDNSLSNGKILEIADFNKNIFYHDAQTDKGSSGAPILLEGEIEVIGVHEGANGGISKKKNGIFIHEIVNFMKDYKNEEK